MEKRKLLCDLITHTVPLLTRKTSHSEKLSSLLFSFLNIIFNIQILYEPKICIFNVRFCVWNIKTLSGCKTFPERFKTIPFQHKKKNHLSFSYHNHAFIHTTNLANIFILLKENFLFHFPFESKKKRYENGMDFSHWYGRTYTFYSEIILSTFLIIITLPHGYSSHGSPIFRMFLWSRYIYLCVFRLHTEWERERERDYKWVLNILENFFYYMYNTRQVVKCQG